ncbi:hypothetical protein BDR26DRAFT_859588 [Obelidium mucronatum]|nr:hypothetical protein BDR26DRAFT_859588 [Obelidium mucronatum]
MQRQRSIATLTNALIKFPWRPTSYSVTFLPASNCPASIPALAKYILNPIKKQSSKVVAQTIVNNALGPDYMAHDFVMGASQVFPLFCEAISFAPSQSKDREIRFHRAGQLMTGPLREKFLKGLESMALAGEAAKINAKVNSTKVTSVWVQYGEISHPVQSIQVKKEFEDGSRLLVLKVGDSAFKEGDFIYEWNNLRWVLPRKAVIRDCLEVSDSTFERESTKAMTRGFSIGVESTVNADIHFQYNGKKVIVDELCRRGIKLCFQNSLNGQAENIVQWRISNIDSCI